LSDKSVWILSLLVKKVFSLLLLFNTITIGTITAETAKAETVITVINKIGLGLDLGILILDSWLLILIPSVKSLLFSFLIFVF